MNNKNKDFLLESYNFDLPDDLIANSIREKRDSSKILIYDESSNEVTHSYFKNLAKFLNKDDLLIFNQSKVFPCRLIGCKTTGAKVEVFFLKNKADSNNYYNVFLKSSGKKILGMEIILPLEKKAIISEVLEDGSFNLTLLGIDDFEDYLEENAETPLPPYIKKEVSKKDKEFYQTIYAKETGSVAAPTAGLHFSKELFLNLEKKGVAKDFVTLHVGPGTFKPVTTDDILNHHMHEELYTLEEEVSSRLNNSKKVIAVGTTSLRVLESSFKEGKFINSKGFQKTDIFLHPGKDVNSIDGLITNFHLPKSSLLMLVSSLIGREKTLELYDIAIKNNYKFYSYGDGMLILRDRYRK